MRKKIVQAVIAAAMASVMTAVPVLAAPAADVLKEEKAAAENEVSSLQAEMTKLLTKISQLENDLIAKGGEADKAEEELEAARQKEKEQYEDMKLRIRYMYEGGNTSAVETFVTAKNFTDMVNKAEYAQNVHSYDRNKLKEYAETKQQVEDMAEALESELESLENMQTEFSNQKVELDAAIAAAQTEVSDLDGKLQAAVMAAEEQRRQEEDRSAEASGNTGGTSETGTTGRNPGTGNPGQSQGTGSRPSEQPSYQGQGNTAVAQAIVNAAYSQLGVPYKWGGTTPGVGLDCSGLVQYAHRVAGISIPRNSEAQYAAGRKVSNPEPGDIAWKPGHVGVYIGNGKMIEAQQTGTNIMISNVRAVGYARFW